MTQQSLLKDSSLEMVKSAFILQVNMQRLPSIYSQIQ
jgi:hypothetical protein